MGKSKDHVFDSCDALLNFGLAGVDAGGGERHPVAQFWRARVKNTDPKQVLTHCWISGWRGWAPAAASGVCTTSSSPPLPRLTTSAELRGTATFIQENGTGVKHCGNV